MIIATARRILLGKVFAGTKTVTGDSNNVSARKAFPIGLIHATPFNGFSGFGYHCNPWHDRWTKTHVIDIKKLLPL
ncbi:hypothetical protein [Chitinophaga sp. Ak27]|uniref:hypothetical protein n=1 Tax=Chitinophaga sp. Ak27 TaxID=2726116 RepID=UPI00145CE600|nr:hypothetical protein [Chitinophaga sp. Ak27]NLU90476.1 hypothetical protein [Chitinophaga sp. Ak27]